MTNLGSTEWLLEVSLGNVPGFSGVQISGRNDNVTAAEEDVWAGGGTRAYLTSAETMDVVSSSASDDGSPAGTGAHTVTIEGLDGSYAEVSETVTMNGTAAVTTVATFLRVNKVYVNAVGSGGANAGQIAVDPTTSGSGSRQALIAAGDGQSLLSHYTVPEGKTAYLVAGLVGMGMASGANSRVGRLRFRTRVDASSSWRTSKDISVALHGASVANDVHFTIPESFPEHSDLRWTCLADTANSLFFAQYTLLLEND